MSRIDEIKKRRTFAIISHPDAGKTTLTEKFLLYGGAINQAGSVKGKATAKHAVSDWMDIEKERGISVTSSVLQFEYGGCCINILDPGYGSTEYLEPGFTVLRNSRYSSGLIAPPPTPANWQAAHRAACPAFPACGRPSCPTGLESSRTTRR